MAALILDRPLVIGRPPLGMLALAAFISAGGATLSSLAGWPLWGIGVAGVLPWLPLFSADVLRIYRRFQWLALFYALVVTQAGHFFEHVAQMVQIHVMHLTGASARGIFGALDIETVHFVWNTWVIVAVLLLLSRYGANRWLWLTAALAGWHEIEHVYIFAVYLSTGVSGTPGLLSRGGALWGGLPISRPDLHFLYNLIETAPLIVAFAAQVQLTRRAVALTRRARPAGTDAPVWAAAEAAAGAAGATRWPMVLIAVSGSALLVFVGTYAALSASRDVALARGRQAQTQLTALQRSAVTLQADVSAAQAAAQGTQSRLGDRMVASGGGTSRALLPAADGGSAGIAQVYSFDRGHALVRISGNTQTLRLPTYELGTLTVPAGGYFVSLLATSVDSFDALPLPDGSARATLRGTLACVAEVARLDDVPIGSRTDGEAAAGTAGR